MAKKNHLFLIFFFLIFLIACAGNPPKTGGKEAGSPDIGMIRDFQEERMIAFIDFSHWDPGPYGLPRMFADFNPRLKNNGYDIDFFGIMDGRVKVVKDESGSALEVFLPAGQYGPGDTGMQIFSDISFAWLEAVYVGVSLVLPVDYEFSRETKIAPGIYAGEAFGTGGNIPDGRYYGSSVRADMKSGRLLSYIYHMNQSGREEDGRQGSPKYGDKFPWRDKNGGPVMLPADGEMHDIMFFLKMNDPGEKNGIHRVWFDGHLVLELTDLELRATKDMAIDTFGLEFFNGGNDPSYSTRNDNFINLTNVIVYPGE